MLKLFGDKDRHPILCLCIQRSDHKLFCYIRSRLDNQLLHNQLGTHRNSFRVCSYTCLIPDIYQYDRIRFEIVSILVLNSSKSYCEMMPYVSTLIFLFTEPNLTDTGISTDTIVANKTLTTWSETLRTFVQISTVVVSDVESLTTTLQGFKWAFRNTRTIMIPPCSLFDQKLSNGNNWRLTF